MKSFLRYFGAVLFLVLAGIGFALFEYLKLMEQDTRHLYAASLAAAFFAVSVLLFSPLKKFGWRRCLKGAVYVTLIFSVAEFGFLKWRARSDLNRELQAKGRCDSVLVELLGGAFDGTLKAAQNACTLRILQSELSQNAVTAGEEKIGTVTRLLSAEDRLDETALVLLLSDYSNLEGAQNEKEKNPGNLDLIKNEFNFVEGAIPILEIYHVKALFDAGVSVNMEKLRLKKLVEISTLGKTLGVFISRSRAAIEGYNALVKLHAEDAGLGSGEVTLLGLRVQKIKDGYNRIVKLWDLSGNLESLNVKETYPAPYEKVRQEVSYEVL